jgi:hypothetical protein
LAEVITWLQSCIQLFLMAAIGAALVALVILLVLWVIWAIARLQVILFDRARLRKSSNGPC